MSADPNPNQPVIDLALTQVGANEEPPRSNRGPLVDLYTGGNAVPWCALGICFLFRTVGRPLPGDYEPSPGKMSPLCSVTHMERVFSEHGWAELSPRPGSVVFYATRGLSDRGPGRHVGLVVAVAPDGKTFETVEFNWSDGVRHRTVNRNDPTISGFGFRP